MTNTHIFVSVYKYGENKSISRMASFYCTCREVLPKGVCGRASQSECASQLRGLWTWSLTAVGRKDLLSLSFSYTGHSKRCVYV